MLRFKLTHEWVQVRPNLDQVCLAAAVVKGMDSKRTEALRVFGKAVVAYGLHWKPRRAMADAALHLLRLSDSHLAKQGLQALAFAG
jgi:hypothetical protein